MDGNSPMRSPRALEALAAGEIFQGKYRIERVIGRGGMGVVAGARHLRLDEPVAIKLLLPELAADPALVVRFLGEARSAAKIKSDHVARIFDVDITPAGVPYIVMEWLDGRDLLSLCRERKQLDVAFAVRCVIDACEALAEAHAAGIVHRDIKPANLFLARCPGGAERVKVLDFGVSKQSGAHPPESAESTESAEATRTGMVLGTISYMAPEQMRSSRTADARADIWSLGVTLYRLVTGRLPFHGPTPVETGSLVLLAAPALPSALRPGLPRELDAAILKCLEKSPERRFASARELSIALAPFAGRSTPLPSDGLGSPEEITRVVRRNEPPASRTMSISISRSRAPKGILVGVLAAALAAVLSAGLWGFTLSSRGERRAAPYPRPAPDEVMPAGSAGLDPVINGPAVPAEAGVVNAPLVIADAGAPASAASVQPPAARNGAQPRGKRRGSAEPSRKGDEPSFEAADLGGPPARTGPLDAWRAPPRPDSSSEPPRQPQQGDFVEEF